LLCGACHRARVRAPRWPNKDDLISLYFFAAFPAMLASSALPEMKGPKARLSEFAQGWPSDLPVEQASKYDLVLNLKTAIQYQKGKHRS